MKANSLDAIWQDDLLGRRSEADFLETTLKSMAERQPRTGDRGSLVVNLKAPWGHGKTFFLKHLAKQLRASGHKVAELNAWRADPEIDPLVSLMGAIEREIGNDLKDAGHSVAEAFTTATAVCGALAKSGGKAFLFGISKKFVGDGLEAAFDAIEEELSGRGIELGALDEVANEITNNVVETAKELKLDVYRSARFAKDLKLVGKHEEAVVKFSMSMSRIAKAYAGSKGRTAPFYVLIDELDRCRPTYAIEILERINHLFDIPGVVFIVGTHSDELQNSINAVYGSAFNASGYLNRFFDLTYNLSTPDLSHWIEHLLQEFSIDLNMFLVPQANEAKRLFRIIGEAAGLSFRDFKQVFLLMQLVQASWQHPAKLDLISLYAFAIAVHLKDDKYLAGLTSGQLEATRLYQKWKDTNIVSYRQHALNSGSLTAYLREIVRISIHPVEKTIERLAADNGDTIKQHQMNLLRSQCEGRPLKAASGEPLLCGTYVDLLRTARRVQLPEAEQDS